MFAKLTYFLLYCSFKEIDCLMLVLLHFNKLMVKFGLCGSDDIATSAFSHLNLSFTKSKDFDAILIEYSRRSC